MITATHSIIYCDDPEGVREFLRDKLGLGQYVDDGDGWLIFKLPPGEIGIHPAGAEGGPHGMSELYFMCDDVAATMVELEAKGVEFRGPPMDQGFGLVVTMAAPGGLDLHMYEPRHKVAYDL